MHFKLHLWPSVIFDRFKQYCYYWMGKNYHLMLLAWQHPSQIMWYCLVFVLVYTAIYCCLFFLTSLYHRQSGVPQPTNAHRLASLMRYKEKRKNLNFDKRVLYTVRKEVASRYAKSTSIQQFKLLLRWPSDQFCGLMLQCIYNADWCCWNMKFMCFTWP